MIQGKSVRLRAIGNDDMRRQWEFNNHLEVELAGGGDPPTPQSLERLYAEYDQQIGKAGRDGPSFGIEADCQFIGQCALFNLDAIAGTSEIGITIGDKRYWGRGFGREAIGLRCGKSWHGRACLQITCRFKCRASGRRRARTTQLGRNRLALRNRGSVPRVDSRWRILSLHGVASDSEET